MTIDKVAIRKQNHEIYLDYIDSQISLIQSSNAKLANEKEALISCLTASKQRYIDERQMIEVQITRSKTGSDNGADEFELTEEEQTYLNEFKLKAEQNITQKK